MAIDKQKKFYFRESTPDADAKFLLKIVLLYAFEMKLPVIIDHGYIKVR
jgi:hypothetical protein